MTILRTFISCNITFVVMVSASSCVLDRDGLLAPGSGGSGGTTAMGGGGTPVVCQEPSDCPGEDTDCAQRTCESNICGTSFSPAGTSCAADMGACNGSGECLLKNGADCATATDCASGFCADGACCNSECDGECAACGDAAAVKGTCSFAVAGTDPEMECAPGVCDGTTGCANGEHVFSTAYGPNGGLSGPIAVAADSMGNIFMAGSFSGTLDFGDGPHVATGTDGFVVKLDPSGTTLWTRTFTGAGTAQVNAITVDLSSGAVIGCGEYDSDANLGASSATSAGLRDMFVVRLDADGNHVWEQRYGDASQQRCTGIGANAAGDLVFVGAFEGTVDFGMGTETSAGSLDVVAAKLSSSGATTWVTTAGSTFDQAATSVSVDPTGGVWLTGDFIGGLDFGSNPLNAGTSGAKDAFVAKLDASGSHLFSTSFGAADSDNQFATAVAADSSGGAAVVGFFGGTVDFGGGDRVASGGDGYVVTFDSSGQHQWDVTFGDGAPQRALDVAVDAADNVVIIGDFDGSLDLGGGVHTTAGLRDLFVGKWSRDGTLLWSIARGDVSDQYGQAVSTMPSGNVVAAGRFNGFFSFGGGQLSGTDSDIFLAILEP